MPQKRQPMVRWYDPLQLLQTAGAVVVSSLFGRHSDHRLIEALMGDSATATDLSDRDELVLDYVGDVGDGWNSTYAIAYHMTRPALPLEDDKGTIHHTRRGDVLVFGGDQVYPTPSRREYEERLVQPYETASQNTSPPHPLVFAIPGNHDWYDSLVSFTRLFCRPPKGPVKWFAGWCTAQTRSYFAIKLPGGWWLAGLDVQLGSNIDEPQVAYFRDIAGQMRATDRVILCTAEPDWIYTKWYGDLDAGVLDPDVTDANARFVEEKLFGNRVRVSLAGDLHHYRRHERPDGRQKITAGGGGAFLHPTHAPDSRQLADGFECKKAFPDSDSSKRMAFKNLLFPFLNPTFGLVTGLGYMLVAWTLMSGVIEPQLQDPALSAVARVLLNQALANPQAFLAILLVFVGFYLFTDTHSKRYRFFAGLTHAAAHLVAAVAMTWIVTIVTSAWFPYRSSRQLAIGGACVFAIGWFVGSMIMGIYLLVSLNGFGRHSTEAFSSLHIEDWKSFLRLVVRRDGTMNIYPIGIRRVPRTWQDVEGGVDLPLAGPADPNATNPVLIEGPIPV